MSNLLFMLFFFAALIQFLVDRVKEIASQKVMRVIKAPVWAAAFGIAFAIMFRIDFFAIMGHETGFEILSWIITGLILSSGSTGIHDLLAKLRGSYADSKKEENGQ